MNNIFKGIFLFVLHRKKHKHLPLVEPAMCCRGICPDSVCIGSVSSWSPISSKNSLPRQRWHTSFYACRDIQSVNMIEINLCVLLGLSRANQLWLNCVMTSISVGGNSSCHLVWLHNREALCWNSVYFILVEWKNVMSGLQNTSKPRVYTYSLTFDRKKKTQAEKWTQLDTTRG